ncbi:MAG: cupin domain-containing protein [Rhodospirillaceae bacterium]|nr:cupin domain-containing protein [Rhodospirillales bacterium]
MRKISHALLLSAATAIALCSSSWAADKPVTSSKVIVKSTTSGDGVPLVYPTGTPEITSRVTTFPPGAETPLHRHPQPLYAYILEGELTLMAEGEPVRKFKAGDGFMESTKWHMGRNDGDIPVKLLSVYAGAENLPLSELATEHNHK